MYVCIFIFGFMVLVTSIGVGVFRNTFLFCLCVFDVVLWSVGVVVETSLSPSSRPCR